MVSTGLWKWARRALYPNRYSKKVLFCITSLVCDILWLNETYIWRIQISSHDFNKKTIRNNRCLVQLSC